MTTIPKGKLALVRRFAAARAAAGKHNRGPDTHFATCWRPRLAGRYVRNADDPDQGFDTRTEAIDAARKYRESCRAALTGDQPRS